ncbi:MAG: pseudouridine synthase [Terracidiphilus sp.]
MTDNPESKSVTPNPDEAPKAKKRKSKAAPKSESKTEAKPRNSKAKPVKPVDPIGDLSDGEAASATGPVAEAGAAKASNAAPSREPVVREETTRPNVVESTPEQAEPAVSSAAIDAQTREPAQSESKGEENASESEQAAAPHPPRKLERLQKILAQAGIASRRSAETMITEGRVQVNGKVVTQLGSKADAAQDHIRVDGKLLHGAERLRYYMLNKPKGFVTTVKDPEGRPTVMQFFEKMAERLYPVGRLDYQSEGLLLVTNDGELANKLTKAASGVEKTYLVKVSGQPTEDQLDILRGGVSIERGKAGEGRVRTAPARIRQVRQGDNPWYEVVLIEGRNRELRKMFEEIGHFVEKIRRVGYGPLVLDQEPGNLRELEPEELAALRLAADGKLRTPKAKELRRRNAMDAQLPTLPPRPTRPRPAMPFPPKQSVDRPTSPRSAASVNKPPGHAMPERTGDYRPRPSFNRPPNTGKPSRPGRPPGEGFQSPIDLSNRRGPDRGPTRGPSRPDDRASRASSGPARFGSTRPAWQKDDRSTRPSGRSPARPEWNKATGSGRNFAPKVGGPGSGAPRTAAPRRSADKPAWTRPPAGSRPPFNRTTPSRPTRPVQAEDLALKRPSGLRIDAIEPDQPSSRSPGRPASSRPPFNRPGSARPSYGAGPKPERPRSDRPRLDKPRYDKAGIDNPRFDRPRPDRLGRIRTGTDRSGTARPFRGEGGLARPFTTSSGKPRAGGARPSTKPSKPGGRSYGSGSSSRPARTGGSGPRSGAKSGWKPKPGGPGNKAGPAGGKRTGPQGGNKRK